MGEQKECIVFINSLRYGMGKEEACRIRTRYCVEWYTKKAIKYKHIFIVLSVINIVIPQINAIVILEGKCTLAGAVLSAIVSVSAALLALLNVREKWTSYRSAAEYIKRQYTLYCGEEPPFQGEDAHGVYLSMLEQYMTEEHSHWAEMQQREHENEK